MLHRCNTVTAVIGGSIYDDTSAEWSRFTGLVDQLDSIVDALPGERKNGTVAIGDVYHALLP